MLINLIEDNSLRATRNGYQVAIRLLWYRTLPLSCIESVQLTLDGQQVASEIIRLALNDHEYALDELPQKADEDWFVLDSAVLNVHDSGKVAAGESHTIEVETAIRAPYIPTGPGKFLTITNRQASTQVATGGQDEHK